MKKTIIAIAVLFLAGTSTFAQDSTHKHTTTRHQTKPATKYTCTMHPEVVKSKPGKCPKCGMDLVAMKQKKSKSMGKMKM